MDWYRSDLLANNVSDSPIDYQLGARGHVTVYPNRMKTRIDSWNHFTLTLLFYSN